MLCRIAPIGMIQLDTTPTGRILHSLCRAESGVRSCTEIGANGQPDKALLTHAASKPASCEMTLNSRARSASPVSGDSGSSP